MGVNRTFGAGKLNSQYVETVLVGVRVFYFISVVFLVLGLSRKFIFFLSSLLRFGKQKSSAKSYLGYVPVCFVSTEKD